jgi:type IV pilus assembly protein PilQ
MIESKFVEVTNSDVKNIGVNWASLSAMKVGVSGINQTFNKGTTQDRSDTGTNNVTQGNAVTYVTSPTTINGGNGGFANSTLNLPNGAVTNQPASVPGTTGVADFKRDPDTGAITYTAPNTYTGSTAISDLASLANGGTTARVASAVFSASDFNIILSALKTQNNTKLVSNPTVVTLNNSEAQINIGKEYPIPNYTYNQERGTYEVSGFTYRPIGVILKVTPQVNARGFIKLTVEPEVSSSNESASFGTASIPIITTRKTKTQVSLKDGYTMGIGGLIDESLTTGQTKVPVLGSIPVLGRLFRSDSKDNEVRNLIIFITARTVSPDGAPINEVFSSQAVRQLQMKRSDLPGYRDGSDPFLPEVPVAEEKK